jgi:ribosomal protein L29
MAHHATPAELRNMQAADLQKELHSKQMTVAKMRLGLELRSEKDSALYRREKREIARIMTVLTEKLKTAPTEPKKTALKTKSVSRKVRAPRSK